MCPPQEIYDRTHKEHGAKSNFEQKPDGSLFEELAVKRFKRCAAGNVDNPAELRPPIILYHSFSYLRDCIMDQDRIPQGQSFYKYPYNSDKHEFEHIYGFLRDRFR